MSAIKDLYRTYQKIEKELALYKSRYFFDQQAHTSDEYKAFQRLEERTSLIKFNTDEHGDPTAIIMNEAVDCYPRALSDIFLAKNPKVYRSIKQHLAAMLSEMIQLNNPTTPQQIISALLLIAAIIFVLLYPPALPFISKALHSIPTVIAIGITAIAVSIAVISYWYAPMMDLFSGKHESQNDQSHACSYADLVNSLNRKEIANADNYDDDSSSNLAEPADAQEQKANDTLSKQSLS